MKTNYIALVVLVLVALAVAAGAFWYLNHDTHISVQPYVVSQSTSTQAQPTVAQKNVSAHAASGTLLASKTVTPRTTDLTRVKFMYFFDGSSIFYVKHSVIHDLPTADAKTFFVTDSGYDTDTYALDKNSAYFFGVVVPGADPATFRVLGYGDYATDAHSAYWDGTAIQGVDLGTFTADVSNEAKDKNHVYCNGNPYPIGTSCSDVSTPANALKPLASL